MRFLIAVSVLVASFCAQSESFHPTSLKTHRSTGGITILIDQKDAFHVKSYYKSTRDKIDTYFETMKLSSLRNRCPLEIDILGLSKLGATVSRTRSVSLVQLSEIVKLKESCFN